MSYDLNAHRLIDPHEKCLQKVPILSSLFNKTLGLDIDVFFNFHEILSPIIRNT